MSRIVFILDILENGWPYGNYSGYINDKLLKSDFPNVRVGWIRDHYIRNLCLTGRIYVDLAESEAFLFKLGIEKYLKGTVLLKTAKYNPINFQFESIRNQISNLRENLSQNEGLQKSKRILLEEMLRKKQNKFEKTLKKYQDSIIWLK